MLATQSPRPSPLGRIAQGFSALRNPNYRRYWLGQLVSMTGSWMQTTVQALLVLQLSGSPLAIGLIAAFQFTPFLLLSLVGGVLADRVPRYRLIMITQVTSLILAAVFGALVLSGAVQLWHVYLLALLLGTVNAIDQPVRQAFAITLVSGADRANAISLNSILFNTARILGPALAGLLVSPIGIGGVLLLNAVSFAAVLISMLRMDAQKHAMGSHQAGVSVRDELRQGLGYIRRTPSVLLPLVLVGVIGTFGYNFSVTLPLIGGFILHTTPIQYGLLGAALGVGSLLAAVASAYRRSATLRQLVFAAVAFSLLLGGAALVTHIWASMALLLVLGFAGVSFTTNASVQVQLHTPDDLRGRITSIYQLLFAGTTPIGGLILGAAAAAFNVPFALILCAALCLIGIALALVLHQRRE